MPDPLLDEVLVAWQEGEQLLPDLSPLSPDHEAVRLAINDLRNTYMALTDRGYRPPDRVLESQLRIERSTRAIREVGLRNPRAADR